MKGKILKVLMVLMIIMCMTLVNFLNAGMLIAYAVGENSEDTNVVDFDATLSAEKDH